MLFVILLTACGAAAATGAIFKPGVWYEGLKKPAFTPPKWVFPVAWTTIYILLAWAGARLATLPDAGLALALWALQIALNTLWTPVFFGARQLGAGMAVLALLWVTVAALVVVAFGRDSVAGWMLLPYLLWLCIAAALNWRVWRDNPRARQPG